MHNPPVILLADDDVGFQEIIRTKLKRLGFLVAEAHDGREAVDKAVLLHPDLILMDVRMPKMTGYEACRAMKADPALKDIPVVFLSAKGQDSEIQTGLDVGAEEYLLKPFAPDQLTDRVKTILAKFGK